MAKAFFLHFHLFTFSGEKVKMLDFLHFHLFTFSLGYSDSPSRIRMGTVTLPVMEQRSITLLAPPLIPGTYRVSCSLTLGFPDPHCSMGAPMEQQGTRITGPRNSGEQGARGWASRARFRSTRCRKNALLLEDPRCFL